MRLRTIISIAFLSTALLLAGSAQANSARATKGDAQAWTRGDLASYYPGLPMHYRSQWYTLDDDRDGKAAPLHFGMGIHGQNLFVDPANELVIAKFASQAMPMDAGRITATMQGIAKLRASLA